MERPELCRIITPDHDLVLPNNADAVIEQMVRLFPDEAERKVIPGLSSMIEVMEAATALTNLRYAKNSQGAIYGYEQSLENPYTTRLDNKSPLKGLYFASAWTSPGGGYSALHGIRRQSLQRFGQELDHKGLKQYFHRQSGAFAGGTTKSGKISTVLWDLS